MADARTRALEHIRIVVNEKPAVNLLKRIRHAAPDKVSGAMGRAVAYWHGQVIPRVPVRASRAIHAPRAGKGSAIARGPQRVSRVGRGMLKKSIQPFVTREGAKIIGGLKAMTHYAIWLTAGTRRIARGKVMAWREGMPPVTDWKAKRLGGNPRAEMPILLPQRAAAVKELTKGLAADIAKG